MPNEKNIYNIAKEVAEEFRQGVLEDEENWPEESDKIMRKKMERKKKEEEIRTKVLQRKHENDELIQKEVEETLKEGKFSPQKKAWLAMKEEHDRREEAARKAKTSIMDQSIKGVPITETQLRNEVEGPKITALDKAIAKMNLKHDVMTCETHPEHLMQKAYIEFEEKNFPILAKEHSNMRPSEVKQLIHRMWLTSDENPMNKPGAVFNQRRGEKEASKHPPAVVKV